MNITKRICIFSKVIATTVVVLLCGCATQYTADADADQLVAAMDDFPEVQSYLATVKFYPELNNPSGKAEATNADSRNLNTIIYSEKEMLNQAAHASIFRWFQDDGKLDDEDVPVLNIHARIFKLDHSLKVEKGQMRPVAMTKLEVYLTDSEKNRVYESVFTADAEGELIKRFRNRRETQDMYGYTIYKALSLAFEAAFKDISDSLNLKPIEFDVDQIEIDELAEIDEAEVIEKSEADLKNSHPELSSTH